MQPQNAVRWVCMDVEINDLLNVYSLCLFTKHISFSHVAGGSQYTSASCVTLREEGAACRTNTPPMDIVLSYPNGDTVNLTNVYYIICDCAAGLTCVQGTCVRNSLKVEPEQ